MAFRWVALLFVFTSEALSQGPSNVTRPLVLEGQAAEVVIDTSGGAIASFRFKNGLNPLSWQEVTDKPGPRWKGHFLCLDRWGPASGAEERNGMPFHGEASRLEWKVLRTPTKNKNAIVSEMEVAMPLAGLKVHRQTKLSEEHAVVAVREQVTNTNKLGRVYNMVQHPTIGPPFLDETTVIDANGRKGLISYRPLPNPEEPAVYWPQALKDGQPVNIRYLVNDHDPNVAAYTIDDEYGWVVACNASKGLLIGYLWKAREYPWLIDWRHVEKGKPFARGLEFGTTSLPHPDSVLIAKGPVFGRPIIAHLDAGQAETRSYAAFLFKIPKDYRGVAELAYDRRRLVLKERFILYEQHSPADRDLVMETGDLFGD
jgi:hypothetical protein